MNVCIVIRNHKYTNQLKKVLSNLLRGTLCEFYKLCRKEKYIVHKLTSSSLDWYQIYWQ